MDNQPTKEDIAEYKEAFSLFDKKGDGVINVKDLGMLIRSLNKNPSEEELQMITLEVDPNLTGYVEFPDFLTSMAKRNQEVSAEEELEDAFRQLQTSKEERVMSTQTLRHLLQRGKDGFTDMELDEMVKLLDPQDAGEFKIETFINIVVNTMEQNKIR